MANLPENNQYFQSPSKTGAFLGIADTKDVGGRPYFAYKLPNQATTTDLTRVASTFDPRVAQPLSMDVLHNNRMPYDVSSQIKKSLGGQYSDELDHSIALELLGSNNPTNLRIESGRSDVPGSLPGESTQFDTSENNLAQQVVSGKMSLFDAQHKLASDKALAGDKNPIPWTDNLQPLPPPSSSFPNLSSAIPKINQDASSHISDVISNAFSQGGAHPYQTWSGPQPTYSASTSFQNLRDKSWIPPVGQPLQSSTGATEALPSYQTFEGEKPQGNVVARNYPGGGQYVLNKDNPEQQIKTQSIITPAYQQKILGGLSSNLFKVDHIIPTWAGGTDSMSNIQVLANPTAFKKQDIESVPFTLLANGKIDLNQAKAMIFNWKDKTNEGIPTPDASGLIPLDAAQKISQRWQEEIKNPAPVTFGSVMKEFPEQMGEFGRGFLPTPVREFGKGLVGGATAGIVPGTGASEDSGTIGYLSNLAGNVAGMATGIGFMGRMLGKAGGIAGRMLGLADSAAESASLAPVSWASKSIRTAGLLGTWGQIGLTGRELTGQEELSLKNHMTQFLSDAAYGALLGPAGQNVKGYLQVGLGSTILSLMEQSYNGNVDVKEALKQGALMSGLHIMGFKGRFNEINDINYKRSVANLNRYLGDVVPTIKKGQGIPDILKLDVSAIDKLRIQYQKDYPNEPLIANIPQIKEQYDAVDFLTKAALVKHGDVINNSIGKTDIPQEQIDAEIRGIGIAGIQLYNQTLSPELRLKKQIQDLQSIAEQLKPQISSAQLKQRAPTPSEIIKDLPFNFPEQTYENPEGKIFPNGTIPTTGMTGEIDPISKENIIALDKETGGKTSNRILLVNDEKTNSLMRRINYEAQVRGEKPPIAVPEDALRAYYIEQGPNGIELKPVAYAATSERIGERNQNFNENLRAPEKRLKSIFEKAETPEDLMTKLNKDISSPNVDIDLARKLFEQKETIMKKDVTELFSMIKAANPMMKYDTNFNNSVLAQAMRENNLSFLTTDLNKISKTKSGNYHLVLSVKDKHWLESMAARDGKVKSAPAPVQQGIKNIVERQKAGKVAQTAGLLVKKATVKPQETIIPSSMIEAVKKVEPTTMGGFSPKEITKLAKDMKMPESKIIELIKQGKLKAKSAITSTDYRNGQQALPIQTDLPSKIVSKAKEFIQKPTENAKEVQTTPATPILASTPQSNTLPGGVKTLLGRNIPLEAKTTPTETKMTQKEVDRVLYKKISEQVNQVVQKATDEGRLPNESERKEIKTFDKKMAKLIRKNKQVGTTEAPPITESETISKNDKITDEFFNDIVDRIEKVKSNITSAQGNESQLMNIIKGFKRENPGLPESDFKDIMNSAKGRATAYAQNIIDTAWKGTKKFGTDEDYARQQITESAKKEGQSLILAKQFGLKLQEPNKIGMQFLVLKNGNPIFSEEFKKENNIKNQTPLDLWGSFLGKEMDVYKNNLSKTSKEWSQNLKEMEKSDTPYAKGMAKTFDLALKEKYGNWDSSWKASSALKNIRNYFEQFNQEGYEISQPFRRTIAKSGGSLSEIQRKVAKADTETKVASEQARIDRANRFSVQEGATEGKEFSKKDIESMADQESLGEDDLKSMRTKDPNQIENVSNDLTPFDIMTQGLLQAEVRNTFVDRYNNLRKEMSDKARHDEAKILFQKIKELSKNIPEESKTWKLGERITLKNKGEPTIEEGIKDAQTILTKIFKDKSSKGYVHFDKIRESVLKSINKTQEKSDGKGGMDNSEQSNQWGTDSAGGNNIYFKIPGQDYSGNNTVVKGNNNSSLNIPSFLKAIASNETGIVKGNKYISSQYSNLSSLGQALGKYRVTEGELKSYAPRYLGKPITKKEFLSSPKIQDTYMTNKAKYLNQQGYSPQEIADIHNKGITNSFPIGSGQYQNPNYVQKFNNIYSESE